MSVKCLICGIEKKCSIVEHLKHEHKMSSKLYKEKFPNSIVKSKEISEIFSLRAKKMWDNPEYKERMVKIRNITHKDPNFRQKMSEKIKKIHKENPEVFSGFTNWSKTEEFKKWVKSENRIQKISETSKKRWKDNDYRNKTIESIKKVLNDGRCDKSKEFKLKMSEKISQLYSEGIIKNEKNKYKTGKFKSKNNEEFIYSSSYELDSMIFLDSNEDIVKWTNKHGIRIKYYFNGLNRNYIPDFLIELSNGNTYIIEMKGWETEEVIVKEYYAKNIYPNYKIFYSVNDLKKFIYENK